MTADEKKSEAKIELQREYIIPLRRNFLKVPIYLRAKRATKEVKTFLAKHMKVENRDEKNVKLDIHLNNEIWFRGIKNPLHKIKVKAVKKDGIVYAELAEVPDVVKFRIQKQKKFIERVQKVEKKENMKTENKTEEQKTEELEKEKATQEAGVKENKAQAKAQKHTEAVKHEKNTMPRRNVLQR